MQDLSYDDDTGDDVAGDNDHAELRAEMRALRREINGRFDRMSEVLQAVLRLEGTLGQHEDALRRIGRQVDDHEQRVRTMEGHHAGDRVRWSLSTWIVALLMTTAAGVVVGLVSAAMLYMLGMG